MPKDIEMPEWRAPSWKPNEVAESLNALHDYVEKYVQASIDWYYQRKKWKAKPSQILRVVAILATAIGTLMPVLASMGFFPWRSANSPEQNLHAHQFGYICFGIAALCIAIDKFFGLSTGWMRYIGAAMSLQTAMEQFRFDWAKMTASLAGDLPCGSNLEALIQRIAEFSLTSRTLVEKETQAWIIEFQTNLSQLEKEARAAVDAARTQVGTMQKDAQARKEATLPGAINLTIENFPEIEGGYNVAIDRSVVKQKVMSKTCGLLNITPGFHEVLVTATMSGTPAYGEKALEVKAAALTELALSLHKAKSAGQTG